MRNRHLFAVLGSVFVFTCWVLLGGSEHRRESFVNLSGELWTMLL